MMTGSIADALKAQYQDNHVNDAVSFVNSLAAKAPPEPTPAIDPYAEEVASAKKMAADAAYQNQSWGDWAADVGKTAVAAGKAILPTALGGEGKLGISDLAKGAVESVKSGVTLPGDALMNKVQVFDETGKPTDEMMRRAADFAGLVTVGPAAIPAEANTLRMGAKGVMETKGVNTPAISSADQLFVQFGNSRFRLNSLEQASTALTKLLDETSGTFSGKTGPKVDTPLIIDAKGDVVAHVSQNGKVWAGKPEDWSEDKLLFDPYNKPAAIAEEKRNKGMVVYRGSDKDEDIPKSVHFSGVYTSTDRSSAAQYGKVKEYILPDAVKLLDINETNRPNSLASGIVRAYLIGKGEQLPSDPREFERIASELHSGLSGEIDFDTQDWSEFVKSFGFDGTKDGKDILVYDHTLLKPLPVGADDKKTKSKSFAGKSAPAKSKNK